MIVAVMWLFRLGLGGLFVFAGVSKLRDPMGFAQEISHYQLAPQLAPYGAMLLPAIEIVLGAALVIGSRRWRAGAALGLVGLLLVFTGAVLTAVVRGINIDCGCFGAGASPVTWWTVARDVGLLAVAGTALIFEARPKEATGGGEQ
jgi:uncharacterized membrane protein YphA (DoxX/SURF4 family)